jgi:Restriction endonuclease
MPADPITDCLERLTDYAQFERLCCALLSQTGYPQIEPLGGTGDDGLDAIVRDDKRGRVIAFAFTVRKDWFPKLKSDSSRVAETQKGVNTLVYACTSSLSAAEKNKAFAYIRANRNWGLDLIDIKYLRMHLVSRKRPAIPSRFPIDSLV